ncbi:S41 family peptidase [Flavihumibacter solisilvae]|nr:S41 family peptidase [Flavihumibacter solisilvae]
MKRGILVGMLSILAVFALGQSEATKFTISQLKEDHELLVRSLKEAHAGLYRYTSREQMDRLFEQTRMAIDKPMTEKEFYRLMMPVITAIKCGHTKFYREGRPDDRYAFHDKQLFPLKLYFSNGNAYVRDFYATGSGIPRGARVNSINGLKIPDIIRKLREFIPVDANVQSTLNEEMNLFFNGYFSTFISQGPQYEITWTYKAQTRRSVLHGVHYTIIRQKDSTDRKPNELPLRLQFDNSTTAIMTIENFYVDKGQQDYFWFIDSSFRLLKERNVQDLVIDLRNNEGGIEEWGGYLYSYLADRDFQYYSKIRLARKDTFSFRRYAWLPPQYDAALSLIQVKDGEYLWPMQDYLAVKSPQANAFSGKVYMLVNGLSFSVTSELAAIVQNNTRAEFIGEETGGAYQGNNSGVFAVVTLPNTRLTAGIPLMAFYMNVQAPAKDRGVIPGHIVRNSIDDVLAGRDAVMEYTLQLITKSK